MNISKITKPNIIKPVKVSNEEKNIIQKNIFRRECDNYFKMIDRRTLKSNIYHIGKFLNIFRETGINEYQANLIMHKIEKLLQNDASKKNINLINVIYSTLLKSIKPNNLMSGELKPDTYRKIINDSINMYKNYPLKGGIDYRHVLGRLAYLNNINYAISQNKPKNNISLGAAARTENDLLSIIHTTEKIISDYKDANARFAYSPQNKKCNKKEKIAKTTLEDFQESYLNNIVALLKMLKKHARRLLSSENPDVEEINYRIDLAEFYIQKIPYNDASRMPIVGNIITEFKDIASKIKNLSKGNRY